jgi:hypothetical protein
MSHCSAIDRIKRTVVEERIQCDFLRVDGYLFLAPGHPEDVLDRKHASARRAGLDVVRIGRAPRERFDSGPCLRFPGQAQFHALLYLAGLRAAASGR